MSCAKIGVLLCQNRSELCHKFICNTKPFFLSSLCRALKSVTIDIDFLTMSENNTRKYADTEVATQHNQLINSQQSLSVIQKRIFYLAIQQIRKGDKDFKRYYIDISDIVPGTSQDIFKRVEAELEELRKKDVKFVEKIKGEDWNSAVNLIAKSSHKKGTGQIYVDLHPDIRDMLLDLKKYFTRVPVVELIACRSIYGQRLYELLYQYADTGIRLMTVEELREKLNLQNKYENFAHFRRRVLEQAQEDVEKHTNMRFTWQELKAKKGRKIDGLIFDIKVSDPEQTELDFDGQKVDMSKHKKLQENLRQICQFSDKNIRKVLRYIEEKPDHKIVFHNIIHKTEIRVKDGDQNHAKKLTNPEAWAMKMMQTTLPDFD